MQAFYQLSGVHHQPFPNGLCLINLKPASCHPVRTQVLQSILNSGNKRGLHFTKCKGEFKLQDCTLWFFSICTWEFDFYILGQITASDVFQQAVRQGSFPGSFPWPRAWKQSSPPWDSKAKKTFPPFPSFISTLTFKVTRALLGLGFSSQSPLQQHSNFNKNLFLFLWATIGINLIFLTQNWGFSC